MVIEHIVEAIHAQELNGARRGELVILCGANARKLIEQELKPKFVATDDTGKRYPLVEKYLGKLTAETPRAEIKGVPVVFDVDCPTDYWRVQRLPAIAHPPEFGKDSRWRWNAQKQNWIRNEKTRCPLCGKESDQAPMSIYGMKVVGCPCVETFAGGRYDAVMIDKEQWQKAIDDAYRDCAEALRTEMPGAPRAEPFSVEYKGARNSERWSDTPVCGPTQWRGQSMSAEDERTWGEFVADKISCTAIDGMTEAACMSHLINRGHENAPYWYQPLTSAQMECASRQWSAQLRELQAEARRKEREQVVVDIDWE